MKKKNASTKPSVWIDPDDAPPLMEKHFAHSDWYRGDKLIRRGRPSTGKAKEMVSLRVDRDVVESLKKIGPSWRVEAAAALRAIAKLPRVKRAATASSPKSSAVLGKVKRKAALGG